MSTTSVVSGPIEVFSRLANLPSYSFLFQISSAQSIKNCRESLPETAAGISKIVTVPVRYVEVVAFDRTKPWKNTKKQTLAILLA